MPTEADPRQVSSEPGEYAHTQWSPDGAEILATRGSGATVRYRSLAHNPWYDLVLFPADGPGGGAETGDETAVGTPGQLVVRVPGNSLPTRTQFVRGSFGPEGRIYYRTMGDSTRLVSVARDGTDRRTHLVLPWADEIMISPDGRHAAFNEGDNAYLVPVPGPIGGESVPVAKKNGKLPVRRLSTQGGIFPGWRDANTVEFGNAATLLHAQRRGRNHRHLHDRPPAPARLAGTWHGRHHRRPHRHPREPAGDRQRGAGRHGRTHHVRRRNGGMRHLGGRLHH